MIEEHRDAQVEQTLGEKTLRSYLLLSKSKKLRCKTGAEIRLRSIDAFDETPAVPENSAQKTA